MKEKLTIIQLADKIYALLKRIDTGHMSIVWKAGELVETQQNIILEKINKSGPDLVSYLREAESPKRDLSSHVTPGTEVALKVARAGMEQELHKEANVLSKFQGDAWHHSGQAQIVRLIEDLTPDMPVLISEWVDGVQLDNLSEPFSEQDGLFLADQLAALIRLCVAAPYRIVLTDTLKPNSLFWKSAENSLVLIDWNVLGKPEDFRSRTLPIMGNTLHTMLVGKQVYWDNLDPNEIGGTPSWISLTYGTMALVRRTLLADFNGRSPSELARQLSEEIKEQWELWDETAETLLAQARSKSGEESIRRYDLARAKLREDLPDKDAHGMLEALKETIAKFGDQDQYKAALITLSWARDRYPQDRELRWFWLAYSAIYGDRSLNQKATSALGHLRSEQYEKVIEFKKEDNQSEHLQALYREAEVWQALKESKLEEAKGSLDKLSNLWRGHWDMGGEAIADVKEAASALEKRIDSIEDMKGQLRDALKQDNESLALDHAQELLKVEPEDMPYLEKWKDAIKALVQEEYEKALRRLSTSEDGIDPAKPDSDYANQIWQIACNRLAKRAEQAEIDDCYASAVRDLEVLAHYGVEEEKHLDERRKRKSRYEELQAEAQGSLSPQEKVDAYDRWIEAGFSYDTNGRNPAPERNLIKLRLERSIAWADRLAERQHYAEAVSVLLDRALPNLRTPKTRKALKKLPCHQQDKIKSLSEQANNKIEDYRQRQQEEVGRQIKQIRERDSKPGESIDKFITSVNTFIHKALEADRDNNTANEAKRALEALQDGRIALKNRAIDEAVEKLSLAERYAWDNLKTWIAPYQKLANIQHGIDSLASTPVQASDWIDHIEAYDQASQNLGHIQDYDENQFDSWLNQRLLKLKEDAQKRLDRAFDAFGEYLEEWVDTWKRLTVGGNALAHRVQYQELLKVLEVGQESTHSEYAQKFEDWINKLKQQCNIDLAQALLLKAYEHHQSGHPSLADGAERQAKQLFNEIPQSGKEAAKERLHPEIVNILRWHWLQAFKEKDVRSSPTQVHQQVGEHIRSLAEAILSSPDEEAPEKLRQALQRNPHPSTLAKCLAQYSPAQTELLKKFVEDYSYETAAKKVKEESYEEAYTMVDIIEALSLDNSPQPVVEALQSKIQEMWKSQLEGAEDDFWVKGVDEAYKAFDQLGEHQSKLNQQLLSPPPTDLARSIDKFIKGDIGGSKLVEALAQCSPEDCRPLFYHPDRAVALIESEAYQQAQNLLERVDNNDIPEVSKAIQRKVVEHCKEAFKDTRAAQKEDFARELSEGLKIKSTQLEDLACQYMPITAPDVEGLAAQMVDALLAEDEDQFVAAMSAVPIPQWNSTLRRNLRSAFAKRYIDEVKGLVSLGWLRRLGIWLTNRMRIKNLEQVSKHFNRLEDC